MFWVAHDFSLPLLGEPLRIVGQLGDRLIYQWLQATLAKLGHSPIAPLSFLGHLSWWLGEFPDLPGDPMIQELCLGVVGDILCG